MEIYTMKKLLLASTIAALSVSAAHAAPTVYGKAFITADYEDIENDTSSTDKNSLGINSNYSRIGFKGSEAMTENTDVIYQLEYQTDIDNDDNFTFKNRDTYLGLKNDSFGQVRFGHQHSTLQWVNNVLVGKGYWDRAHKVLADSSRIKNSVHWIAPKYQGVQFTAMYGADEENGNDGDGFGASLMFDQGSGFTAGVAYESDLNLSNYYEGGEIIRGTAKVDLAKMSGLPLAIGGLYQVADFDNSTEDETAFAISAEMGLANMGKPTSVYAQYISVSDRKGFKDVDADQVLIGATYKYQPNMIIHAYAGNEDIDGLNETTTIGGGLEYLF